MASEASRNPMFWAEPQLTRLWYGRDPCREPEEDPTCCARVFNTAGSVGHLLFPMRQGRVRAKDPVTRSRTLVKPWN